MSRPKGPKRIVSLLDTAIQRCMVPARMSFVVAASLIVPQFALAKGPKWDASGSIADLSVIEQRVGDIQANYERRGSVLGQTDAEERFNNALGDYLLGDYKRAAEQFYVLLETESVYGTGFVQEAEWYLIDSAFQAGQYALVEEFARQISNNPGHMFFTDAIRLLLESHGLRGRPDKFREDYRRFVLSGYVEASDPLQYAIGKSLYFQGETAQAKQELFEIQQGSQYWHRTQYFLGGIYVAEKNLDKALQSFEMSWNPEASTSNEIQLNHLTLLAKARVLAEQGQYTEAVEQYNQIPYSSPYFFDRLYETAWTFIRQEQWQEAIDVIQTFLLAYPENENTIRFRNTLGDLYMQVQNYEVALEAYSGVLAQMEPVRDRLVDIMTQEPLVLELLDAKLSGQTEPLEYDVPKYIEDRLYKDPDLVQTAKLVDLAREQRRDVKNAQGYIEEIEAVLQNPDGMLYSFVQDQTKLNMLNQDMLLLLLNSLEEESKMLASSLKDQQSIETIQRDIEIARAEFEDAQLSLEESRKPMNIEADSVVVSLKKLQQDARDARMMTYVVLDELEQFVEKNQSLIQGLPSHEQQFLMTIIEEIEQSMEENQRIVKQIINEDTERLLIGYLGEERYYKDILAGFQADAAFTQLQGEKLLRDANHFLDDNASYVQALPPEQLEQLKAQLSEIQSELKSTNSELEDVASDTMRNVMLAKMGYGASVDMSLDSYLLKFQQLHNQMMPLWSKSSIKNKQRIQQDIDSLWLTARKIDGQREDILATMAPIQDRQRVVLLEMLAEQEFGLNEFADTVVVLAEGAEGLGYQAAYHSFENAKAHVEDRMLAAELGGVKVTWIRSTDIDAEITRLTTEEANRLSEMNKRFSIIKAKLSDSFTQE